MTSNHALSFNLDKIKFTNIQHPNNATHRSPSYMPLSAMHSVNSSHPKAENDGARLTERTKKHGGGGEDAQQHRSRNKPPPSRLSGLLLTKKKMGSHRIGGREQVVDVLDVYLQEGHFHPDLCLSGCVHLRYPLERVAGAYIHRAACVHAWRERKRGNICDTAVQTGRARAQETGRKELNRSGVKAANISRSALANIL